MCHCNRRLLYRHSAKVPCGVVEPLGLNKIVILACRSYKYRIFYRRYLTIYKHSTDTIQLLGKVRRMHDSDIKPEEEAFAQPCFFLSCSPPESEACKAKHGDGGEHGQSPSRAAAAVSNFNPECAAQPVQQIKLNT